MMPIDIHKLSRHKKLFLHVMSFAIGVVVGGFLIFQILFLMKVLPHGGF